MAYKSEPDHAAVAVEWFAGQIPSPIQRLRFLREVSPSLLEPRKRRGLKRPTLIFTSLALLLITGPPPARVVRAAKIVTTPASDAALSEHPAAVYIASASDIWLVEKNGAYETYSNGLRIESRFATANHRRSYLAFSAAHPDGPGEARSTPAGIVFHTTESLQAPFEASQNSRLKRIGESLLEYVRRRRSYNFLIDRFGRVFRIVEEADAANHAGYSVWSDPDFLYLNLNESFLGVSFETETLPGQEEAAVTPAQMQSAAMLTDMLRRRYSIPAGNCVTHAQVSVNASNLRIGYHLDWASSFPFEQIGLPDNYARLLPSVGIFGFEFDADFEHRAGARMYRAAEMAEESLRDRAAAAHVSVAVYRNALQQKYRRELAAMRGEVRAE